jgi:hypothetical protein
MFDAREDRDLPANTRHPAPHTCTYLPYGSILLMCGASAAETKVFLSNWRFLLLFLDVRIWRENACPRMIFPPDVSLNRLAAPLWVFNFNFTLALANFTLPKILLHLSF